MKIKNTTRERYMAWRERTGRGEFFTINHMPYHYTEIDMMLGIETPDPKPINTQEELSYEDLETTHDSGDTEESGE